MSVLPILTADNPLVRDKSKKLRTTDPSLGRLITDMMETMRRAHGVGLAAPQIGRLIRMAVIEIPGEEVLVLLNPEIIRRGGERHIEEGCLSIPGYRGTARRSEWVTVKALNRHGREIRINRATGLLAQALEHEIDHLDGTLYVDRLIARDRIWRIDEEAPEHEDGAPERNPAAPAE
ncbi:MAG: peptide deformylase [Chloroflexi bacterium]|nr:peptide deformylase [Chloroflexota bacterium]